MYLFYLSIKIFNLLLKKTTHHHFNCAHYESPITSFKIVRITFVLFFCQQCITHHECMSVYIANCTKATYTFFGPSFFKTSSYSKNESLSSSKLLPTQSHFLCKENCLPNPLACCLTNVNVVILSA